MLRTFDARMGHAASAPSHLLLTVPHRLFFLAGVAQIALVSLWWLWVLAARAVPAVPPPASAMPDTIVHALVMTCGFAPFFMFGFMFTAGPRWLGVPPPAPRAWMPAGIVAALGALALVPLQVAGIDALRVAAAAYAAAWLWLLFRFVLLIRASDSPDRVHAMLVAAGLTAGMSCVVAFAAFGTAAYPLVSSGGVWLFLLPVFVTVCHRMIPFFTSSAVPFVTAFRPWWLLTLMVGAPVAHAALSAVGLPGWTWLVDLPVAAAMLAITVRWGFVQSMSNRLLAMLHVGFVWYAIGFLLAGTSSLWTLAGGRGLGLAPLHALTIGFAASLLVAMVTRVTCGHSGRTLAADALTWRLFQLLQVAAVLRIAAELVGGGAWFLAAALCWAAGLVPWCAKYAPVYWRPRPDGRPG
ncbi:MAG: NnrS family protein [Burkholderiales bacterium]|nr:NnrS family protein [Burkholderiales bacterium]